MPGRRQGADAVYLFHDYDFQAVQENQRQRMKEAIDAADADTIGNGSVGEVADAFVSRFRLDVPELTEGAISVSVDEAQVDVTGDPMRMTLGPGPHYVSGIRATYFVPYVGERDVFKCRPSTYTSVIPAAELANQELRFTFDRPDQNVAATKAMFDEELSRVKQYLGWLRDNATTFDASLSATARTQVTARRARLEEMRTNVASLGIPIRRPTTSPQPAVARVGESRSRSSRSAHKPTTERYDVALSFAGEDRAYVEQVALGLKAANISVFYDAFESAALWGKNLVDHLAEIYQHGTRYVVMFISVHYVEKAWPTHERQSAQARSLVAKEEYILPARFDDTPVPGMTNTISHADLRKLTAAQLVERILEKLGKNRL